MTDAQTRANIQVDSRGRIVIPSAMRQELGIRDGDILVAYVESSHLVLERRESILARVVEQIRQSSADVNLVDEPIGERREQARGVHEV